MQKVLQDIKDVDFYVDDVLEYTGEWQAHMGMLRELLAWIRKAGLTVRPTKTKIGFFEVDFVGLVVRAGKMAMDPGKLDRIHEALRPWMKEQVRAFLGLVGITGDSYQILLNGQFH